MRSEIVFLALSWLGTYLLHSTLLLGGVWLLARRGLLRTPRLAERMWRLAVVGGVLTATLQVGLGAKPFLGSLTFHATPDELAELAPGVPVAPTAHDEEGAATDERVAEITDRTDAFPLVHVPLPELALPESQPLASPANAFFSSSYDAQPLPEHETTAAPFVSLSEEPALPMVERALAAERPLLPATTPASWFADDAFLGDEETGFALAGSPAAGPFAGTTLPSTATRPLPWKSIVVALWILVGGLGITGFLWAWSRLIVRLKGRREIVAGPLREKLTELSRAAGLRGRVALFASSTIASPMTYGWLRRRVCIPVRALTDLSPVQQESMLAHELAHVKRRDPLWFCVYTLCERVLFFQPMNRTARRELQDIAELLCDDWAVRWTGGRLALASCLTEVAEWIVGRRHVHHPALPSSGMAGQPSRLGVRVGRLLDDRESPKPEPAHAWWSPFATTSLALIVFAAPGVSSSAPEPGAPSSVEPELGEPAQVEPAPERVAEPVFESAPAVTPSRRTPLAFEFELLEESLTLLEDELDAIREAASTSGHADRFAGALRRKAAQIESLRQKADRLAELIDRAQNPQLPTTNSRTATTDGRTSR